MWNIKSIQDDQSPELEKRNRHFLLVFWFLLTNAFNVDK